MNKRTSFLYHILAIAIALNLSCIKQNGVATPKKFKVSVMTYNVENLFDTTHDDGKLDFTFLPMEEKKKSKEQMAYCKTVKVPKWKDQCMYLDWSKSALVMKKKNLANVILQVNHGKGPDILILQEVENLKVLKDLVDHELADAQYTTVLLVEGKDVRGIDTAVVSRLPVGGEVVLHEVPFQQMAKSTLKDTRGILEVPLLLPDGEKVFVYSNHFPAPFHSRDYRIQAYQFLGSLMEKKGKDVIQIAGGDFNTPSDEDAKYGILSQNAEKDWIVAHKRAYKGIQGSSYYPKNKTWSFLDMILLSKNLEDGKGWEWIPSSFVVANQASGQLDEHGFPQSFDTRSGIGASDHLPVYVELEHP